MSMLGWMARPPWFACLLLGVLFLGCALDDNPVVYIRNGSAIPVEVVLLHDGGSESLVDDELRPGGAVTYNRMAECVQGVLIARDSDGQEVARSARPVCRGSEWVITSSPAP